VWEKRLLCADSRLLGTLLRAYASAIQGTVEEKEAFVRAAHDRGVTLFNSANIYSGGPHGHNEVRVKGRTVSVAFPRRHFVSRDAPSSAM
jgi:hypothetical protein